MGLLDKINLLERVASTVNHDDGIEFTDTQRLDFIGKCLAGTPYQLQRIGLCHLYSREPLEELKASGRKIMVISSHVDTHKGITEPFSERISHNKLRGTYDNSITNAAVLSLMMERRLPANVLVAFTGNEEYGMRGAADLGAFLRKEGIDAKIIVNDVTSRGYRGKNAFTIENSNHSGAWTLDVMKVLMESDYPWKWKDNYLDDETAEYAGLGFECLSFCIPTKGEMHDNSGLKTRVMTFYYYIDALDYVCSALEIMESAWNECWDEEE